MYVKDLLKIIKYECKFEVWKWSRREAAVGKSEVM